MLKLVIFDFDGVIIDSEPLHFSSTQTVLKAENIDLTWQQYCDKYLGYDDRDLIAAVFKDHNRPIDRKLQNRLLLEKKNAFALQLKEHLSLLPGVKKLLDDLKNNNIACSMCSGALKSEIEFVLKFNAIQDYFTVIISAEDVTKGKPAPEGYMLALKETNKAGIFTPPATPQECIVIEDSVWGIEAAHAAGIKCLAVKSCHSGDEISKAEAITDSLTTVDVQFLREITEK